MFMFHRILIITAIILTSFLNSCSQHLELILAESEDIKTGAQNLISSNLDLISEKKVGIVANQASIVHSLHLVDTLLALNIEIVKIFSPEHGFRGKAEAGAYIQDGMDTKTGLEVISLYGDHKKPTLEDLKGIDVMLFDLQDVGVRYYTYISTLSYVMEACGKYNIPIVVLDRPNPNGFYIDGPVLKPLYSSFVGLHPVPIVYGMTIGEYALMVKGEHWQDSTSNINLTVIPLKGYSHHMLVKLPVKPSPNLPNWESVYLYPSLCLFEGTSVSVGRGTDFPFQIYGHPDYYTGSYSFTPKSIRGVSENPKFKGIQCVGQNLNNYAKNFKDNPQKLNLLWLIHSYELLSKHGDFFNDYFEKLAGTDELQKQIESGLSEEEIRESWQLEINKFKEIRKKYLLYD